MTLLLGFIPGSSNDVEALDTVHIACSTHDVDETLTCHDEGSGVLLVVHVHVDGANIYARGGNDPHLHLNSLVHHPLDPDRTLHNKAYVGQW